MFFFFNKIIRITQFSKLATNCSSASPNTMIDRKCKSSISLTVDNLLHSLVRRRTKNFCNNTRNAGHDKAERSKKSLRLVEKGSDDYWNDARDSNSSPLRGVLKKKKKKIRRESKFYSTVPVFPRRKPLDGGARANKRPIVRSIATYFRPRSALRACACVCEAFVVRTQVASDYLHRDPLTSGIRSCYSRRNSGDSSFLRSRFPLLFSSCVSFSSNYLSLVR